MLQKRDVYVVLLHYPIVNRHGQEVTTAVTNLDIHDIARSCKTFGVKRYFIVNPEADQKKIVDRILGHWDEHVSKTYHPARASALAIAEYVYTFEEVLQKVGETGSAKPFVVMPDARPIDGAWSYSELRKRLESSSLPDELGLEGQEKGGQVGDSSTNDYLRPLVIVFGTGWGIAPRFYPSVDKPLKPILGPILPAGQVSYNHLSVRAAAAIVLEKLFGSAQ